MHTYKYEVTFTVTIYAKNEEEADEKASNIELNIPKGFNVYEDREGFSYQNIIK